MSDEKEQLTLKGAEIVKALTEFHEVLKQGPDAVAKRFPHSIRLPRDGDAPLCIVGTLVAESDGHRQGDTDRLRWHDIAIYRLTHGDYAVAINYRTAWRGELGGSLACIVPDA